MGAHLEMGVGLCRAKRYKETRGEGIGGTEPVLIGHSADLDALVVCHQAQELPARLRELLPGLHCRVPSNKDCQL